MSDENTLKPKWRAHETFFIRKGWLSKGLRAIEEKNDLFIDRSINPMDELGIGSNMVKSLRYWLQAVGVTSEESNSQNSGKRNRRVQEITDLGQAIINNDPFLEELGTLWVLHYQLVNQREFAPSWYFFFNKFNMRTFTQEDFVRALGAYAVRDLGVKEPPSRSSIDDFNCILSTYISRGQLQTSKVSPENNIDCPFGELELLGVDDLRGKVFRKRQTSISLIPSLVGLYSLLMFCQERRIDDRQALNLEDLLNAPGSPGKAFNLDSFALLELLRNLQNQGYVRVIRTAGLDEVRVDTSLTPIECLRLYYEEIG